MKLSGKVALVTGTSTNIGGVIAEGLAAEGAALVCVDARAENAADCARYIKSTGGRATAVTCDVTDESQVIAAVAAAREHFGGVDIVVNNASAISLTPVAQTDMKRFDLMHQINARGTFVVSKLAIPYLAKAANPHILMMSPPLDMKEKWFAPHTAYSMAKFGMSLVVLGLAGELRPQGIAVNALWPRTLIATAAVQNLLGGAEMMQRGRKPEIVADAAYAVFAKPSREFTGNFLIDDNFLAGNGVTDFERYRVDPGEPLARDFFLPDDITPPPGVTTVETYGDRR